MDYQLLIKHLAKPAIQSSMPIFKKLKDKVSHSFNDGMMEYFDNSLSKYKETKTLLHRQPTYFYKIFYPTTLHDRTNEKDISSESVKNLFKDSNFVTIIGDAGSGKSTLLKHFFISTFIEYFKAPILVNLRDLTITSSNLETFIRESILNNKLSPSDTYLEKLLKDGEFLFFLDGYDEIKSTDKHEITKNLENFVDKYPKNKFLLTSRPYSNIEFFKNFTNLHIKDLNKDEQILFIEKQIIDKRLSSKIVETIEEAPHDYIGSFFKNALLLTLYIMAYSKNSSIPNKKYIFYMRVFDVLFAEHDSASKIGFEREIKTLLNQESLEKILKTFCFLSFFDTQFDFKKDYIFEKLNLIKEKTDYKFSNNDFIDDMKLSIGLWQEDCGIYSFAHRSMQEYFSAIYLAKLKSKKNKESVYKKIRERANSPRYDFQNFLSLCNETDEEFFITHYSLPQLKVLRKLFISDGGVYNLSFEYLNKGFSSHSEHTGIVSFGMTKYTLIMAECFITNDIKLSFLNRIANKIYDANENPLFWQFITNEKEIKDPEGDIKNHKIPGYYQFKKDVNLKDFKSFLTEIGMFHLIDEIVEEIDECITKLESCIENEKSIESDFVEMI